MAVNGSVDICITVRKISNRPDCEVEQFYALKPVTSVTRPVLDVVVK